MGIEIVKIRAVIVVGELRFTTPSDTSDGQVISFNINKSRSQISTFSASVKVKYKSIINRLTNGKVSIMAGVEGNLNTIFTGYIKRASITPCWEDPAYVSLNMDGSDVLSNLEGKKFSRRCRATKSTWVSITGLVRQGLRSGKFKTKIDPIVLVSGGEIVDDQKNVILNSVQAALDTTSRGQDSPQGTLTENTAEILSSEKA